MELIEGTWRRCLLSFWGNCMAKHTISLTCKSLWLFNAWNKTCVSTSAPAGSRLWKQSSPQRAHSAVCCPSHGHEYVGLREPPKRPVGCSLLFQKTVASILLEGFDQCFRLWLLRVPTFWMAVLITGFLFLLQHCICNVSGTRYCAF